LLMRGGPKINFNVRGLWFITQGHLMKKRYEQF
jgi:hypothetical protein